MSPHYAIGRKIINKKYNDLFEKITISTKYFFT